MNGERDAKKIYEARINNERRKGRPRRRKRRTRKKKEEKRSKRETTQETDPRNGENLEKAMMERSLKIRASLTPGMVRKT